MKYKVCFKERQWANDDVDIHSLTGYTNYYMEPKKNLMRTLGITLGIIVVLIGGIWYVKSDIDAKLLAVEQLRLEIQTKEISLSELAKLQSDAEKAKQYIPQIDHLFTTKEQLLGFATDIGFMAKQAGFSGSPQFKEDALQGTSDLQKTNFSLLLEGSKNFGDLGGFFKLVEESKYYVHFVSFNVEKESGALRVGSEGYVLSF